MLIYLCFKIYFLIDHHCNGWSDSSDYPKAVRNSRYSCSIHCFRRKFKIKVLVCNFVDARNRSVIRHLFYLDCAFSVSGRLYVLIRISVPDQLRNDFVLSFIYLLSTQNLKLASTWRNKRNKPLHEKQETIDINQEVAAHVSQTIYCRIT